jgi:hypothetical protein
MNSRKLGLLNLAKNCPCNCNILEHATLCFNPGCGDSLATLQTNDQFDVFVDGCVICKAATNYVVQKVNSLPLDQRQSFLNNYKQLIVSGHSPLLESDYLATYFSSIHQFPDRYNCALLIVNSLENKNES